MKYLFLLLLAFSVQAVTIDPDVDNPIQVFNCYSPIEREDGTTLAIGEIAKIRFYSGTATGNYIEVENKTSCQIVVDTTLKANGDYYYVITAVDTAGRESVYSQELLLTVKRITKPKAPTWAV